MAKSDVEWISNVYKGQMDRPKTQMDSRASRASSSRTSRLTVEGLSSSFTGQSILSRPKTALTNCSYSSRKSKPFVTEEVVELPVCRPTTGISKRNVCSQATVQPESRPKTAPYPGKTWTQLVRDSSFHEETKNSPRKHSMGPQVVNAWEEWSEINNEEEYRIVMLGKAGSGKSSTGNCILNQDIFGKNSLKCRYGTSDRFGKKLCVVDTYGVFDKHSDKSIVSRELVKIAGMTSPGFHVVILVLSIGNISNKEHEVYREFLRHFGSDIKRRTIVLFTRRDILDSDGSTIYGYVSEVPKGIQEVMEQCKRRYIAFNNHAKGRERDVQVRRLLDMIENVMKQNSGRHYTSEVYGATELILKRRMDDNKRVLKERLKIEQDRHEQQMKALESARSVSSSFCSNDNVTPRNKKVRVNRQLKQVQRRKCSSVSEHDDKLTKLPNLNFRNKKDRSSRNNLHSSKSKSSSKSKLHIEDDDDDDDFGDCDIEALKRRIEEDIDIPTLHLPIDESNSENGIGNYSKMNGSSEISDLQRHYEEEMSKTRLREKVREECELEQPELFQMMWKLTRYFDQSIQLNES